MQPPTQDKELSILSYLFQSAASDHDVYHKITDFFPALVYVYDPATNKLVYINKKITEVLGYSYDDLKAWDHNFTNVVFSEDVNLVKEELKNYTNLKDDDSHSYNSRLNHKDGAWRYFKTLGTVLRRHDNGSAASLLFIAQDITDQVNLEGDIKAARELQDDTEELLHFGTWSWDIKSDKLVWSKGLFKLLGYEKEKSEDKISNKFYLKHVDDKDVPVLKHAWEVSIEKKTGFECSYKIKQSGGDEIIVSSIGKVVLDSKGGVEQLVGTTREVTAQMKYEQELLQNKLNASLREQFLNFGSWEKDMITGKLTWSDGMYRLFGYEIHDIDTLEISEDLYELHILPEDLQLGKELRKKTMKNTNDYLWEYEITDKNGVIKKLETYAKILRNDEGEVIKIIGTTRDITELRRFERILQGKISELNRSNKDLEEFAYAASHDLQEPLRKLSTFSERLASKFTDILGTDGKVYTDRILAASENMRKLIDDLLEFSRAARTQASFQPTALNTVVASVITDLELKIDDTKTEIKINDLPVIDGIESQLVRVFNNLISNSIKFRKADVTPVIKISAAILPRKERETVGLPEGTYFKIDIEDNGIGFEPEYEEKIFQIFQRLHGKVEYPGSGVGLAICKKIIERHDGLIYAKSTPGDGSVFSIILPQKHL